MVLGIVFFFQKSVKPQVPVVLVIAAFGMTAGAFAFSPDPSGTSSITSDARVEILSPEPGAAVPADEALTLEVDVIGGELTTQSTSSDPNAGHLHIYVDDVLVSMPSVARPEITGTFLPAGEHEITVEFTSADHRSFEPRVVTTVNVTAE